MIRKNENQKAKWVNNKSKVRSLEKEVLYLRLKMLKQKVKVDTFQEVYVYTSPFLWLPLLLLEVERKFIDFRLCLLKGELPRSVKSFTRKETLELGLRFAKYKYNVKLANCIATQ